MCIRDRQCGADMETGVLEVGPGIGVLTKELGKVSRKVVAVELDRRLFPVLEETLAGQENIKVIEGDILKLDLKTLFASEFPGMRAVVCANSVSYTHLDVYKRQGKNGADEFRRNALL